MSEDRPPAKFRAVTAVSFMLLLLGVATVFAVPDLRVRILSAFTSTEVDAEPDDIVAPAPDGPKVLRMSQQARQNVGLEVAGVRVGTYTQTISVPGLLVDRPGVTDRGVTSPVVGTVAQVHAFPGETVRPGGLLFTVRLYSEYLQQTQKELFQAIRDQEINAELLARQRRLEAKGAAARARTIELEGVERRLDATVAAQRHDLATRGLAPDQISGIEDGVFVSTVEVVAPPATPDGDESAVGEVDENEDFRFEVQSLAAELGQQVQAGQLLATLADHRALFIQGHAFKREAGALARAAEENWTVDVEFAEDDAAAWPALDQTFKIRHLSNVVDPTSRTFDFFLTLTNQSRTYERDGQQFLLWRFRPGQRVRLRIPVEEHDGVIVLPAEAVVREGPEAFAFQQNGDLFRRLPVRVLYEDQAHIVIANDGSVPKTAYLAQAAAATLNRVLKAQEAGGEMPGVHVHADGTVHASH